MSKAEVKRRADGTFKSSGNPDTQFKTGNNANPNGRKNSFTDLLREYSDTEVDNKTRRERLIERLWSLAETRMDLNAMKYIIDRVEGEPTRHIETNASIKVFDLDE
jgi:hypothetical protein